MAEGDPAPEPGGNIKPFTPEQAKEIVMSLQKPAVFCNMAFDWPVRHWSVTYLANLFKGKRILFRIGTKDMDTAPLFETKCSYVEATLEEFLAWIGRQPSNSSGPFKAYDLYKYWTYADYKYIARLFEDKPEHFQDIVWSDFGFEGRNGRESTLWIGSRGANTPCHLDSYGCNLVLQVQGRKRWYLYPPEDTTLLYPTRIPYEESSVFSQVNVANPDLTSYPQFKKAQAHVITLEPGQVLFVPRHWWHYVECIDPITVSVNSWIELDADHEARVEEAITRTLICAIKSAETPDASDSWLNPTEVEVTSHETNFQYLNEAVSAYLEHQKTSRSGGSRDAEGILQDPCKKRKIQVNAEPGDLRFNLCESHLTGIKTKNFEKIPFGPKLLQVLPLSQATCVTETAEHSSQDLFSENHGCFGRLHNAGNTFGKGSDPKASVDQKDQDLSADSPQTVISTNDLLDCVLHPQVVSLMTHLLLERASV
ncbi:HSPB1-associated protein 1 [Sceloporus undulatus]|uniref:HSPB1-associated protein 1 n=1 Tax=Sceloporus undulatus TaxID=8520 RepID=UPI001C4C91A5|nr:HSPB1-associated protein 1 [Sceloporus undulatus]